MLRNWGWRQPWMLLCGFVDAGIRMAGPCAVLAACGGWPLQASNLVLSADGLTVYDTANNISWLADANLAASNRFGLPLCGGPGSQDCVNANGSMNYTAAAAWVDAMNAANYLGHNSWQLPTTPTVDSGCTKKGPNGNGFGYGCSASAMGSLYYNGLGLSAPNTAVPIPNNTVGPFSNLQPYLYWSQTSAAANGYSTFSFDTGWQGANTVTHVIYVLPMIPGKLPGTPAATGQALQVNPGGQTVYDPVSNVTWLANANLATTNTFGLASCQNSSTPAICVNRDGAMNWDSVNQLISNMNSYNKTGYLGQSNWEIPPIDPGCSGFNCGSNLNPMGELFYGQFGLSKGMSAVATPNIAVGPFHNIQPYLYWSCLGGTIQSACQADEPAPNQEFSFSFGNGFEGTDVLINNMFATAYLVGPAGSAKGPQISTGGIVIHASVAPQVSPGSLVDIYGSNLASPTPAGAPAGLSLPATLGGAQVLVNQVAAPLVYTSPTLIIFQLPYETAVGTAQVTVTYGGGTSTAPAIVQTAAPSILTYGANRAVVENQDYSVNTSTNGEKAGRIMMAYLIGSGPLDNPIPTGADAPSKPLSNEKLPTLVTVGGMQASLQFAGMAPDFAGLVQVNFYVPNLAPGDYPLQISFGGAASNQPLVTVSK